MFGYDSTQAITLKERKAGATQQKENTLWIRPSTDEHLTLVTQWPRENNTHHLIIIARLLDLSLIKVCNGKLLLLNYNQTNTY